MTPDLVKRHRGKRRNQQHGGIGSEIAHNADKRDRISEQRRRRTHDRALDGVIQQAHLIGQTNPHHHRQHQTKRRETGEIGKHRGQHIFQAFAGSKILNRRFLARTGMHHRSAGQTQQPRRDNDRNRQINKKHERIGQLIAGTFDKIQEPVKKTRFFHTVSHTYSPLFISVSRA